MGYTNYGGTVGAVFYYGNSNTVYHHGEVFTNSVGEIQRVRIGTGAGNGPIEMPYNKAQLQELGITRITFKVPRALDIPIKGHSNEQV